MTVVQQMSTLMFPNQYHNMPQEFINQQLSSNKPKFFFLQPERPITFISRAPTQLSSLCPEESSKS